MNTYIAIIATLNLVWSLGNANWVAGHLRRNRELLWAIRHQPLKSVITAVSKSEETSK